MQTLQTIKAAPHGAALLMQMELLLLTHVSAILIQLKLIEQFTQLHSFAKKTYKPSIDAGI